MAKAGKINLITEISEVQEENDIIIMTTFKFGPPFFDIFLMNKIMENNPSAEIFILMDGNEYAQSYNSFTKHTGRAYHLIPVFCNKGVFHPKLSLFYSEANSRMTAYIGSCNITLAGFTSNAELITKVDSALDPIDSTVESAAKYFKLLIEKKHVVNSRLSRSIEQIINKLKNSKKNSEVSLLHNIESPILHQLYEKINPPREATLLAPFWSTKTSVIQEINKNKSLEKVTILLQEDNHNLSNPETYETYCKNNNIKIDFLEAEFEKNRYFHSKIIQLISDNSVTLVGSSNMTEYALLKDCNEGNFEVSALLWSNSKEIIDEIRTKKIKDLREIKSKAIEFQNQEPIEIVNVYSVDFDMINQTLSVILQKEDIETVITLFFVDKSEKEKEYRTKNEELYEIHCEKIPFEILIKQETKIARRRIFYDENYIYKKISKGNISLSEINKKISNDHYKINALDLLRILSGLNSRLSMEIDADTKKGTTYKKENGKHFSLPSREINSYHNKRIINSFIDLFKLMHSKKQDQKELQESGEIDENSPEKIPVRFQRIVDEDEEKRLICSKILYSINDLLICKASIDENPEAEIVASSPIMIQSIIKILSPIYIDNELLNESIDLLNENLDNIKNNDVPFEIRKNLFINLVLFNYFFNKNPFYKFISDLFRVDEVIDSSFLQECLNQMSGQIKDLMPSEKINELEIMRCFGDLCGDIPNSSTMKNDLIKSLQTLDISDTLNWEFSKAFSKNVINKYSISREIKDKINYEIKNYSDEQKQFFDNLLLTKMTS